MIPVAHGAVCAAGLVGCDHETFTAIGTGVDIMTSEGGGVFFARPMRASVYLRHNAKITRQRRVTFNFNTRRFAIPVHGMVCCFGVSNGSHER